MNTVKKINKHNYVASVLNSDKNFKIDYDYDLYKYLEELHLNLDERSYISLFKMSDKKRWSVGVNDWNKLIRFVGEEDFYCSVNSLNAPGKHSSKYVNRLNAVIIDLDYYNIEHLKGLSTSQIINLLEEDIDFPTPSFYVDSGRGLYIMWLLETTYATAKSKKYWKMVEETLIEQFKDFGADSKVKDPARVLRVVGTTNSKSGRRVKLIMPNNSIERYELSDIATYYWGVPKDKQALEKPKTVVKSNSKKNKITTIKTIMNLHYSRSKDIEKLVELRAGVNQKGIREELLFIYRLQLLFCNYSEEKSLNMCFEINKKFADPILEERIISQTQSAVENAKVYFRLKDKYSDDMNMSLNEYLGANGVYLFRNSTIIKNLKITEEEMKYMITLINPNEKKRRKNIANKEYYEENREVINEKKKKKYRDNLEKEGKLTKEQQLQITYKKIKSLLEQGLKQKEIAIQLKLGIATVKRHIKFIKENS
ncbi:response regulator transcription factor [Clostridium perfringens]|uniref:response regulator transcription factor n=1 Tax=Clostridium perfringens TaxID=1502 RepID=UPI0018E43C12|nr:response regulator transcription factor [Clostridium perfringens]